MTGSDIALIITAAGTVVTAIGIAINNYQTKKVHKIVNSQHDILLEYQATLITALKAGGIEVPMPGLVALLPKPGFWTRIKRAIRG